MITIQMKTEIQLFCCQEAMLMLLGTHTDVLTAVLQRDLTRIINGGLRSPHMKIFFFFTREGEWNLR